ncbi:hypothetical protein ABZZ17_35780 [Streptomyces sp. NPDC006512]|uniref:hypothetical protein n=1 Tax=Streptomyces sp. NPDC006512 TaxID=3154307 RepID=UPI0033B6D93C
MIMSIGGHPATLLGRSSVTPEPDPFENTDTAMVYDIFAETGNQLIGRYMARYYAAEDAAERDKWWQLVLKIRDDRRAVDPHDRQALLEHISAWKQVIAEVAAAP